MGAIRLNWDGQVRWAGLEGVSVCGVGIVGMRGVGRMVDMRQVGAGQYRVLRERREIMRNKTNDRWPEQ